MLILLRCEKIAFFGVFFRAFKRLHFMHNDRPVSPILIFIIAELTSLIMQKKIFKYPLKQKIGNL